MARKANKILVGVVVCLGLCAAIYLYQEKQILTSAQRPPRHLLASPVGTVYNRKPLSVNIHKPGTISDNNTRPTNSPRNPDKESKVSQDHDQECGTGDVQHEAAVCKPIQAQDKSTSHDTISPSSSRTRSNPRLTRDQSASHVNTSRSESNEINTERCAVTTQTIERLKKFVFFIGYPRSGSSIVASFLDAHPHMIIAHELSLFTWWPQYKSEHSGALELDSRTKLTLFNALSNSSYWDAVYGERSGRYTNKGYSLSTSSPWHGKCDDYLQIIGDKRAGGTCDSYIKSPTDFENSYRELRKLVNVPIGVLHVVRNPYDLIATSLLYEAAKIKNHGKVSGSNANYVTRIKNKAKANPHFKFRKDGLLEDRVNVILQLADAVVNMTALVGPENVLEVHNRDLVNEPATVIMKVCQFLGVECTQEYIETCVGKVFKAVSKTRDVVHWPEHLIKMVEERKQNYPFFQKYTFDGD